MDPVAFNEPSLVSSAISLNLNPFIHNKIINY